MQSQSSFFDGFNQYLLILKRRWLPASVVFLTISSIGTLSVFLQKPIYEAEGKLRFKETNPTSSLTNLGETTKTNEYPALKTDPLSTESEVVRSYPVIKETLDRLKWRSPEGKPFKARDFQNNLTVKQIKATNLMLVSYRDEDPKKAAKAVDTVIEVYLKHNIAANRAEAVAARQFIQEQLPKAELTVRQAEYAVRQFKEENKIIALDSEANAIVSIINDLQNRIIETKSQIANTGSKSQKFQESLKMDSRQAMTITSLSQTPAIQETLQKLQTLESQLASEKSRFTKVNPVIVELEKEKADLTKLLQQQIQKVNGSSSSKLGVNFANSQLQQQLTRELIGFEATNQALLSQIKQLSQIKDSYQQRASFLPKLEQQLRELERKLQASQSIYTSLLEKLQEIRVAENQNIGSFRIVAAAVVPEEPLASKKIAYLASFALALISANTIACLLEMTDRSIKTVEEARNVFGYTWLGVIPSLNKPKKLLPWGEYLESSTPQLIVRDNPASPVSESYRMLQSNLKFISSDRKLKTIVITSSVSDEGKSKVAANLAAAMAQVGKKVLLIDADLHHPMQHNIWDLYNSKGLSNSIAEEVNFRSAIQPVMIHLDVLTSGVVPPSPATLLDSNRMSEMIEYFAANYDFVIIDTPALDFAADAPIIGRMADGVLLVVKPGSVDSTKATFAKEILERSGQNVLGIVINGVLPDKEPHSYYYHALEGKQESIEVKGFSGESKEELWEIVSRLARESKKAQFQTDFSIEELSSTPLENLQEMIDQLQQDLDRLALLVEEQEEELNFQRQSVKQLQQQLSVADSDARSELEEQLLQEQEKNRMLYKTLVGQRRNLEKRKEILCNYQETLQRRQQDMHLN
jgi:capsular exopolysaccharide synthesis family protein